MRKCSYCDCKIEDQDYNFCPGCGNSLNSTFNKTLYVKELSIMHYPDLAVLNGTVIHPKFDTPRKLIVRLSNGLAQYYVNGDLLKKAKVAIDYNDRANLLVALDIIEKNEA